MCCFVNLYIKKANCEHRLKQKMKRSYRRYFEGWLPLRQVMEGLERQSTVKHCFIIRLFKNNEHNLEARIIFCTEMFLIECSRETEFLTNFIWQVISKFMCHELLIWVLESRFLRSPCQIVCQVCVVPFCYRSHADFWDLDLPGHAMFSNSSNLNCLLPDYSEFWIGQTVSCSSTLVTWPAFSITHSALPLLDPLLWSAAC